MARITSDFFVSAYVRRRNDAGHFTAVVGKGAAEAGAIFVKVSRLDGTADLYGPAPQVYLGDVDPSVAGGRVFEQVLAGVSEADVDARLRSERRFDGDCWIIETEDRQGTSDLDIIGT
ncbi:DUF1491 domain-containing protein [Pleomorphomonas diazotrophica]|uniref:DUF1491 domain-containing protein n=1 Tax=Pleomorphomonas diazotrophica TaxID=1166257 RepID=A0A1I4SFN9_9HYPH|nr:DUF1491 family protein [Pleomorphomonas diazotrophica]PKR88926.1 DUF1491 domain-containing protein [Pleomorphomonas diazotrophica]SFM63277.1 hypothetical protein SAMN05192571_103310 [Pleomorphomonas diazotrophica]